MFAFLKEYLFNQDIRNALKSSRSVKRFFESSNKVDSVSILYQDFGMFDQEELDRFIHKLEMQDKDIRVLCFSSQSFEKGKMPSTVFTKKQLKFNGLPKSAAITAFNNHQADLFYNLLDPSLAFTGYMNLMNRSSFRIGLSPNDSAGDLMVKIKDKDLKSFLMTTDHIINNMSKNKNEKSKV